MKTQIFPINTLTDEQLSQVARAVENGALVALATDTVYGLAANAFDEKAITRIYRLKERPSGMALQILLSCVQAAQKIVRWDDRAEKLAQAYWPGALTMILPANEMGKPLLRGFGGLGLRVPAHAGLLRFLAALQVPLACTSANVHGQPVITTEKELMDFCEGEADFILTGGTLSPVASSVVDLTAKAELLREGALSRLELESILQRCLK